MHVVRARPYKPRHGLIQGLHTHQRPKVGKARIMSKNIIFCADGTWNGPGQDKDDAKHDEGTNVFKLYLNLAGEDVVEANVYRSANEQERQLTDGTGKVLQVAKYLHGVGDSDNVLVKLLGGVLGAGVITRIVRGYTFISRYYEPGDRIYIVGFSRGAYTARALAGLISGRGLIDASKYDKLSDKGQAYRLGSAVWADYRQEVCSQKDGSVSKLQRLEKLLDDLPRFFSRGADEVQRISPVTVEAVAVWDTVGALGIPDYQADACRLDEFRFTNTKLGANIAHALHAIAIDEQRVDFTPTLWDADPRVTQMLFPGAHADVGGGYSAGKESGLSDGALQWMMEQLAALKVQFKPVSPIKITPNALAPAHAPWSKVPWRLLRDPALRANISALKTHTSFSQRWGQNIVPDADDDGTLALYKPGNVPPPH